MILPHVFIPALKTYGRKVNRLIVTHPRSLQYVQHDPAHAELTIKYVSGEQMFIRDAENPEYVKKLFEDLVYQIKDYSD